MSAIRALLLVVLACALMPLAPGAHAPAAPYLSAAEAPGEGEQAVVTAERSCRGKGAGIWCGPDLFPAPPAAATPRSGGARAVARAGVLRAGIRPAGLLDPPRVVRAI